MRHKDAVDEIVKTGKAIMSSKNPEEKEMLKVRKYISDLKHFFIEKMRRSSKDLLGFQSGQDPDSPGEVRCCQSAEFGALSAAGASPVSGHSVLGDLRGAVAMASGNFKHLQPAAPTCHRVRHTQAAARGPQGKQPM